MNIKPRLVTTLLRAYPLSWRNEYGSELGDILLSRPLGPRTIGDVFWNGLRQRARVAEAATLCGLAAMVVIAIGFAWNITAPPASANSLMAVLRESSKTLPMLIVAPMASDLYVLLLLACGFWTRLRRDGTRSQSGVAAMRLSALAGLPVMLAGILILTGILGVVVLGPGDGPTTLQEHGFTYTHYSAQHLALDPLAVICAPLFKLPESWLWGVIGGHFGRRVRNVRLRQTAID